MSRSRQKKQWQSKEHTAVLVKARHFVGDEDVSGNVHTRFDGQSHWWTMPPSHKVQAMTMCAAFLI